MLKLWTLLTLSIPETMISVRDLGKLWVFGAPWLTCNGMKHRCCPQPNWRNKTVICDCFSPEDLGTALSSVAGCVDRLPPAGCLSNCSRDVLKLCRGIRSVQISLLTLLCVIRCVWPVHHDGHSSDIWGVLSVCVCGARVYTFPRLRACPEVREW